MVRSGDGELARIAVGAGSERVGSGQEQIRRAGRHSEPLQLAGGRAGEAVSDEEHLVQERRESLEILDFAKVDGAWRGAARRNSGVDEDANEGAGRALVAADSVRRSRAARSDLKFWTSRKSMGRGAAPPDGTRVLTKTPMRALAGPS